ncbi:MAG: DUF4783 domain-containing protein [Bacteroidales bacterium]|nr:DUF4783 domain-containing protein [Bacteroidales bacterium]MBN2762927.1 DUF4783 domain-containing protein [Bacteroidales bacterium]
MNKTWHYYKPLLLLIFLYAFSLQSASSQIPDAVINAINTGNSATLAAYFNSNLEVAIMEKEDIYTRQQAELIMKDFFIRNTPVSFTVLHKGGKETSQYAIGRLVSSGGNYRVTILVKTKENKSLIHQLRFEKDDE